MDEDVLVFHSEPKYRNLVLAKKVNKIMKSPFNVNLNGLSQKFMSRYSWGFS